LKPAPTHDVTVPCCAFGFSGRLPGFGFCVSRRIVGIAAAAPASADDEVQSDEAPQGFVVKALPWVSMSENVGAAAGSVLPVMSFETPEARKLLL
jgi:hypothetical protein